MTRKTLISSKTAASVACALIAVTAGSGCGLSTLTSGIGGSVLGGGKPQKQAGGSLSAEQMLTAAKSDGANTGSISGVGGNISYGCPRVKILPRDHQLTVYDGGRIGDALAVMHRGEITKTARECNISPGQITVKYGFSGAVRLGPKGQTGNVVLPVQLFVADAKRTRIKTERMNVQVNVSLDNPIGYFSHVQTVTFAIPPASRPGEFELLVGFESAAQAPRPR